MLKKKIFKGEVKGHLRDLGGGNENQRVLKISLPKKKQKPKMVLQSRWWNVKFLEISDFKIREFYYQIEQTMQPFIRFFNG